MISGSFLLGQIMREATEQDRARILQYLRGNMKDCIYLYIDIMNYGVSSEHMKVWIEEDADELSLVVMKYYDSFQVYSHLATCNTAAIMALLKQYPVTMVSARRDIIEQLEKQCENYIASYGVVYVVERHREVSAGTDIMLATEEDATEIAKLICTDEEFGANYTVEVLAKQLAERIQTGTGRSYIIRENGEIVAHTATFAEADKIAVVSGTIIRQEYRNSNYYILLSNYMAQQLKKDGKSAYIFAITDKMIRYHDMLHTRCGEYGKLVRKE